ncbi:hypothetical protein [Halorussus sp. MSC15.2]|uniref:hypothetical protein n=1 Tax=Halorussus sp. MSC15.2 TaxID=2283638 RepID=UPI0013D48521|nr:hypothetical protein [Halorussus sp. MSC15.2]NEU58836.1 hypothetical protein [Halorussus sp. MSC15.2]
MDRREMLTRFGGVLGAVSLGGCLGQYEDLAGSDGDSTTSESTTAAGETTTEGEPDGQQSSLTDSSFDPATAECGKPAGDASVQFSQENGSVTVTGTISGSNTCYTAKLADASYDPESGTLDVTVASVQKGGADACAQCIVEIEYEATFSFDGAVPASVSVVHEAMGDTTTVTTAESG